tara:strand:- start:190 stop:585 length:396 start_codon:yes stop_codon:yes gene_type:complete
MYYNKLLTKYVSSVCSHNVYRDLAFDIESYYDAGVCIDNLDEDTDVFLLDYHLNTYIDDQLITGMDVLGVIKEMNPDCKVIMVSSQNNMLLTVEMMKQGIYDYVSKTINSRQRVGSLLQQIIKDNFQTFKR